MATLNMGFSYDLTYDVIDKVIEDNRIGNYAYGYLDNQGVFIVLYVGRSDNNLKERIKHGITDIKNNPTLRFERFKFSYANSVIEAYEKECRNYHDFGGEYNKLYNKIHPTKPDDYNGLCPICKK